MQYETISNQTLLGRLLNLTMHNRVKEINMGLLQGFVIFFRMQSGIPLGFRAAQLKILKMHVAKKILPYRIQAKQCFVLRNEGILRLNQYLREHCFVQRVKWNQNRKSSNKFGNHPKLNKITWFNLRTRRSNL